MSGMGIPSHVKQLAKVRGCSTQHGVITPLGGAYTYLLPELGWRVPPILLSGWPRALPPSLSLSILQASFLLLHWYAQFLIRWFSRIKEFPLFICIQQ